VKKDVEKWVPKPDPKRKKGCAVCGGTLAPNVIEHGDPFCSTKCAKTYHEVEPR